MVETHPLSGENEIPEKDLFPGGIEIGRNGMEIREGRLSEPRKGIFLLGTIKGLVSDTGIVEETFAMIGPDAVCLHISPEELNGLEAVVQGKVKKTPMSSYEMVYARKLSKFGEVQIPSPSLVSGFKLSRKNEIPVFAIDMDDEEYSKVYTETIGGVSMIRSSLRLRSINRKKFKSDSVEDFIVQWDKATNGTRAFIRLEMARERHFACSIMRISKEHEKVLCILEIERLNGIEAVINDQIKVSKSQKKGKSGTR
jgi:hypothetical protein